MKGIVVLVVIIVLVAVGGYFFVKGQSAKDPGYMINWALGDRVGEEYQLHVKVSKPMVAADPPAGGSINAGNWTPWIGRHFELRDAAGQSVTLEGAGTSSLVATRRGAESAFYVRAPVHVGATYTLDYIPSASGSKRYRHTFTVEDLGDQAEQIFFKPVGAD